MGVVYRARDPEGRPVALKLLSNRGGDRAERFAREARLQEQLGEAAGFVPLLDLGASPAGPYLVMPLVSGGTLRARIEAGALSPEAAADLALQLADALGRAHAVGVVHRDVKPDNVLFTSEGKPLVADLGLAKHFRHDLSGASLSVALSRGGEMRGTLGYMAPEQLRDASAAGPPADVFALGAVLYECLAGHPPFEAESYMELLARVAGGQKDPLPESCPPWLREVVDRALDPDPQRRYPEGSAMAAALRLRSAPRSRAPWLLAPLALALLLGGGLAAASALGGAPPASPTPPPSPTPSPAPPRYPVDWEPFLETAELRLTGEWTLRAPALALAPKDTGEVVVADATLVSRVDAKRHALTTPADQLALTLPHETPVSGAALAGNLALAFGPGWATAELLDGTRLDAQAPAQPVRTGYLDPTSELVFAVIGDDLVRASPRSLSRPIVLASFEGQPPSLLASTPDNILAASGDRAFLLDAIGKGQAALNPGSHIADLAFWSAPPRPLLLTRSGALHFFQPSGGPSGDPLTLPLDAPHTLRVVDRRAYLADARRLLIVDLEERRVLERVDLGTLEDPITTLAASPGGRVLALGTRGGRLLRFERRDPEPPPAFSSPRLAWGDVRGRHAKGVTALLDTGDRFVSAGLDGKIHLWDRASGEARASLDAGGGILRLEAAGRDRVLSVSGHALRIWDLAQGRQVLHLPLEFFAYDASLSPSGDRLAVIGSRELEVWSIPERTRLLRVDLAQGSGPIRVVASSSNQVVVGLRDGKIRAYRAGEQTWEHEVGTKSVEELRLHAKGSALLVGCADGVVSSRELPGGEERWQVQAEGAVVATSTDERELLIGLRHGSLELWDLASKTRSWSRGAPGGAQTNALLLPGRRALTGGSTGIVHLFDLDPPHAEHWERPSGHAGSLKALSFSADSSRVLGVGSRAARSWSTSTGKGHEFVSADWIVDAAAGRDLAVVANYSPPEAGRPKSFSCSLQYLGAAKGRIRRAAPVSTSAADVDEVAISEDGSVIAITNRRKPTQIMFLTKEGTPSGGLETKVASALALSPRGRLLAVRTIEGFEVWGVQPVKRLLQIEQSPGHFAFLPTDPPRLALSERLGATSVIDPTARRLIGTFQQGGEVEGVAGTPRGEVVVLLDDGFIELWEPSAKRPKLRLRLDDPHDHPTALAINPTGRLLGIGTGRGRIALFDLPAD